MKILHTSDLHIGKRLHQIDLMDDQKAFFTWLVRLIEEDSIEVLLVSGDIFDVANPSSEARKLYYEFLVQLTRLKCKVIITAGNHDSPAVLEAPREVLKELDIIVVGSQPADPKEQIIELIDEEGKLSALIAAVPFLRDRDLRRMVEDETYEDRVDAIKKGIFNTYNAVATKCMEGFPGIPAIAMGHLYITNAKNTESERDVQIGNMAGMDGNKLPAYFKYFALGHMHLPQEVDSTGRITYCGAPYPLSFSEKDNKNRVVLITLAKGELSTESIEVPSFRKLIKYSGSLEEVKGKLDSYTDTGMAFPSLIELEVIEENEDPGIAIALELACDSFKHESAIIVKSRLKFENKLAGTHEIYSVDKKIEDLSPMDVFLKRLETEKLTENSKLLLQEAFEEIFDLVNTKEN